MRHSRTLPVATFVGALSLIMAGCASPGGDNDDDSAAPARTSINSVLGLDNGDMDSDSYREQEERIQEFISTCMAEEGWEYIPVSYPDTYYDFTEYTDDDELERIEREGFGISYWTLNQGGDDEFYEDPMADFVDPNNAIVEALSEAEMTAYYEALHGSEEENEENMRIEIDPDTGEEYYYSEGWGGGCWGEAQEEVYGDDPWQDDDLWMELEKFYDELNTRVEADPRLIALEEEWIGCMKSAGLEYQGQEEFWEAIYTDLQLRHDEILGDDYWADPFEGWSEAEIDDFFVNATDDEINDLYSQTQNLTDVQRTQLEELLAEEIEIATANHECSKDMYKESDEIYQEIEEAYAEENRAELEQIAAQFGSEE